MHSSENVHTFLIEGIFLKDPPPLIPLEIIEKLHTLLELFGLTESPIPHLQGVGIDIFWNCTTENNTEGPNFSLF